MPPRIFGLEPPLTPCLWLYILYFGLANQIASGIREYHMLCKGVQGLKKFENPGRISLAGTTTDRMTIQTAYLGFSTMPSATKLTSGDCKRTDKRKWQFRCFGHESSIYGSRSFSQ